MRGGTIMAHIIGDECVKCGLCVPACPLEIISEGESKYVIDGDKCIDCGACAGACPVGAPKPE